MKRLLLAAGLALAAACNTHHVESDSKSNWLFSCRSQQDCVAGAACVCGICTKVCADATSCTDLAAGQTLCVDPSQQGLPATCQIDPMLGAQICLLACQEQAECGMQQRCARGVCIGADAAPDAGVPPVTQQPSDAATPPPVGSLDAGKPGPGVQPPPPQMTNPPPPSDPDQDGGVTACPCRTGGFVCHVDGTCVKPGVLDADGVATLSSSSPHRAYIYAADADYVYGIEYHSTSASSTTSGALMRWPTKGGDGEYLAQNTFFQFGDQRPGSEVGSPSASTQPPLIVDGDRLYFLAAADATELSASLWSMPKDDSKPPARHGTAGTVLAQDQDYVYFSNDGDSRVLRTGKATLDTSEQREQIYVSQSDAPQTILLLAVNTSSIFVTELPPRASDTKTFGVRRIDKATSTPTVLGTSDRFTTSAAYALTDDAYFVLGGLEGVDRLDLTTVEVKPLSSGPTYFMSFAAGTLYAASTNRTNTKAFWALDLASARRTWLLANHPLYMTSLIAIPGSAFATVSLDPNVISPNTLVHIVAPK